MIAVIKNLFKKKEDTYQFYCYLIKEAGECDNNRRKSKCKNKAVIALAKLNSEYKDYYHVCKSCADKYIDTVDGEPFE